MNVEIEVSPQPRLSIKVFFFVSDMSEPGRGNTLIVPGSHLLDEVAVPNDGQSSAKGAIPICVPTGAAVIIDRRIWHSRSIKSWHQTRKILFMGYSFRWLLPKDDMTVEQLYPRSRSGPPAAPARQPEQQRHLHSRQRRHATSRLAFAALLRRRRVDAGATPTILPAGHSRRQAGVGGVNVRRSLVVRTLLLNFS